MGFLEFIMKNKAALMTVLAVAMVGMTAIGYRDAGIFGAILYNAIPIGVGLFFEKIDEI